MKKKKSLKKLHNIKEKYKVIMSTYADKFEYQTKQIPRRKHYFTNIYMRKKIETLISHIAIKKNKK